ncbi:MAG: Quinol monooxygenase YgiN [Chloroflexi bacterium]|jgi:quinol monooxygenase YgiN|nr:MAG: Quinol monooxygenase YgiN [Chloroflexota bacterium]
MAVRITVERTVVPGEQHDVKEVLRELRSRSTRRTGFVSGVTMVDAHNPTNFLMISTWTSIGAWESWEKSPERQEINEKLIPLLQGIPKVRMWLQDLDAPPGGA